MRFLLGLAVSLVGWAFFVDSSTAAAADAEKLLLGFEDEEFARIGKGLALTRKDAQSKDGTPYVAFENPGGIAQLGRWVVYGDRASEGNQSLGISLVGHPANVIYAPRKLDVPRGPVLYYGLLNNSYGSGNGARFNTCGVFRRVFPLDWSEFDLLRLDAYCEEVEQTVSVVLEDEEIGPPIVRNMVVSPGKWVTLEVDLRGRSRSRGQAALAQPRQHLRRPPRPGGPALLAAQLRSDRLERGGGEANQVPAGAGGRIDRGATERSAGMVHRNRGSSSATLAGARHEPGVPFGAVDSPHRMLRQPRRTVAIRLCRDRAPIATWKERGRPALLSLRQVPLACQCLWDRPCDRYSRSRRESACGVVRGC